VIVLRDESSVDAASLVAIQRAASVAAFADVFPPHTYPYPEEAVLADLRRRLAVGSELVGADEAEAAGRSGSRAAPEGGSSSSSSFPSGGVQASAALSTTAWSPDDLATSCCKVGRG
jgi:hypothetical protein